MAAPASTPSSSTTTTTTILAVSLAGILAISLLLLAYHLFLSTSSSLLRVLLTTTHLVDSPPAPPSAPARGLDHAVIRRIPTFRYRKHPQDEDARSPAASTECAVCLSEFRDGERLRLLPPCLHTFHIDCIDAWLQATASCPLCRAALVLSSFPCQPPPHIHIDILQLQPHHFNATVSPSPSPSPPPSEGEMSMRDDQCLDPKRDGVQVHPPMRRSFSMDSSTDRHLYLALQNVLLMRRQHHSAATAILGDVDGKAQQTSSSRRLRRSFFSFSHGRISSTSAAILPI